jgi:hypothetical protein
MIEQASSMEVRQIGKEKSTTAIKGNRGEKESSKFCERHANEKVVDVDQKRQDYEQMTSASLLLIVWSC